METRSAEAPVDPLIFEQLVRFDDHGRPQPALALSWRRDQDGKRWEFRLRSGVKFHNGFPLTAPAAAGMLKKLISSGTVGISGETVVVESDRPLDALLAELARPAASLVARGADGEPVGTGPFQMVRLEPGRHATLAAFNGYWGGRPFLDSIEIEMGRPAREMIPDLELGKADLVEISPTEARRAGERGRRVWSSAPVELLAIRFSSVRDPRLWDALSFSIDRMAIQNVLLQKHGEVTAGLLPQWLSGYAFLFPTAVDLPRARKLGAELPAGARNLTLSYDSSDPLARIIAERIAVNARDIGITLHVSPQARADLSLVRQRISSLHPPQALAELAAAFGLGDAPAGASAEALYEAERRLLEGNRVIPLVYLPQTWASGARVRSWLGPPVTRTGMLRLADIWLGERP